MPQLVTTAHLLRRSRQPCGGRDRRPMRAADHSAPPPSGGRWPDFHRRQKPFSLQPHEMRPQMDAPAAASPRPDSRSPALILLGTRQEGPCRQRATEKRDKLAPPHLPPRKRLPTLQKPNTLRPGSEGKSRTGRSQTQIGLMSASGPGCVKTRGFSGWRGRQHGRRSCLRCGSLPSIRQRHSGRSQNSSSNLIELRPGRIAPVILINGSK